MGGLASYRPTLRQAAANGLYYGALGALIIALAAAVRLGAGQSRWFDAIAVLAPLIIGSAAGVFRRRRTEVGADGVGQHRWPRRPSTMVPWSRIRDIRPERRGPRTVVALDLINGATRRLPVPYDGLWLARDPQFEQKLFLLRNLWETYRGGR